MFKPAHRGSFHRRRPLSPRAAARSSDTIIRGLSACSKRGHAVKDKLASTASGHKDNTGSPGCSDSWGTTRVFTKRTMSSRCGRAETTSPLWSPKREKRHTPFPGRAQLSRVVWTRSLFARSRKTRFSDVPQFTQSSRQQIQEHWTHAARGSRSSAELAGTAATMNTKAFNLEKVREALKGAKE